MNIDSSKNQFMGRLEKASREGGFKMVERREEKHLTLRKQNLDKFLSNSRKPEKVFEINPKELDIDQKYKDKLITDIVRILFTIQGWKYRNNSANAYLQQ